MRGFLVPVLGAAIFAATATSQAFATPGPDATSTGATCPSGLAGFTTVDLASYVNSNFAINPSYFPTGTTCGNQGINVPFEIATYGGSDAGVAILGGSDATADRSALPGLTLTVNLSGYDITGAASFYALLNNYFGTYGTNEYEVVINFEPADDVTPTPLTYESVGGVNTRDYNYNPGTTQNIASSTTPWFNNDYDTADNDYQRLDMREFTIPSYDQGYTVQSFEIIQQSEDAALLTGLTFSDSPEIIPTPEPASVLLFGLGLCALGLVRRLKAASRT